MVVELYEALTKAGVDEETAKNAKGDRPRLLPHSAAIL